MRAARSSTSDHIPSMFAVSVVRFLTMDNAQILALWSSDDVSFAVSIKGPHVNLSCHIACLFDA